MSLDSLGMRLYELENKNEALANRASDLERLLFQLHGFLENCDLPYKLVHRKLVEINEVLSREIDSYRV